MKIRELFGAVPLDKIDKLLGSMTEGQAPSEKDSKVEPSPSSLAGATSESDSQPSDKVEPDLSPEAWDRLLDLY